MATFGRDNRTLKQVHDFTPVITISRDNGLSYQPVDVWRADNPENLEELKGVYNWRMQLETPDYPQGDLNLLVRATYGDGSVLTTRQILTVDKQLPRVALLEPDEGGSFNQTLELIGSSSDNFDLETVEAVMWQGFNRDYQTSGLSGLYLEGNFFSTGGLVGGAIGGSALDGLAKIQLGASYMPSTFVEEGLTKNTRFFGYNYHVKLILNLLTSPVSELPLISTALPFLRNFDNVVLSGGVGASFTLFWHGRRDLVLVRRFCSGAGCPDPNRVQNRDRYTCHRVLVRCIPRILLVLSSHRTSKRLSFPNGSTLGSGWQVF
jgi:hypothetical protein